MILSQRWTLLVDSLAATRRILSNRLVSTVPKISVCWDLTIFSWSKASTFSISCTGRGILGTVAIKIFLSGAPYCTRCAEIRTYGMQPMWGGALGSSRKGCFKLPNECPSSQQVCHVTVRGRYYEEN